MIKALGVLRAPGRHDWRLVALPDAAEPGLEAAVPRRLRAVGLIRGLHISDCLLHWHIGRGPPSGPISEAELIRSLVRRMFRIL